MIKMPRKFIVCLLAGMLAANAAEAQLLFGVSIDGVNDAGHAALDIYESVISTYKEISTGLQNAVSSVMGLPGELLGKSEPLFSKAPGTKTVSETITVDVHDPVAVAEVFYALFLQYPSTDKGINHAYEKQGVHLYYDTMVEVQTAADGLLSRLDAQRENIESEVGELIAAAKEAEEQYNNSMSSEDASDEDKANAEEENKKKVYHNAYQIQFKFNRLLRITEEVVALRNQYMAARYLRQPRIFPPAPAVEDTAPAAVEKNSFLYGHEKMAFAQLLSGNKSGGLLSKIKNTVSDVKSTVQSAKDTVTQAKSKVRSKFKFSSPKSGGSNSPFEGSEEDLQAIAKLSDVQKVIDNAVSVHNIMQRMPEYKDMYVQHKMYMDMHKKAVESIKSADTCVVQYLGRRYDEPNLIWFGQETPPFDTCNYDSRKGLSGWAITVFEVANASTGNSVDLDTFAEPEIDSSISVSETIQEPDTETEGKEYDENEVANSFASPAKEQEFSDSIREVSLLNWQIGRKAAQMLTEDQYSENPKFGKAKHPFPLWNDQRSYYDQYISGKYENMKTYMRNVDVSTSALDLLNLINDSMQDENDKINSGWITSISDYLSKNSSSGKGAKLLEAKTAALTTIKRKQAVELAPYEDYLELYNKQLDEISAQINEMSENINKLDNEMRSNEAKAENARKEVQLMDERGTSIYSSSYVMAQNTLKEAGDAYAENITQVAEMKAENQKYKDKRDGIHAKIDEVNEQMAAIKQKYNEEIVAIENDFDAKIAAMQNESSGAVTLSSVAAKLKLSNIYLSGLLGAVDGLVNDARSCAIKAIDDHYQSVTAMAEGDQLYMNSNNPNVVQMHGNLVDRLQKLPENCFVTQASTIAAKLTIDPSTIISRIRGIFKTDISSICAENDCKSADTQYFVGLPAKGRDFTAPHPALTTHYPPVRDMVHFDLTDYRNIEIGADGKISRSAFLDYGPSQPYIWELLLSDKAFVEKGVNLAAVLNKGGEAKAFMRGYMLPCRYGDKIIDIDKKAKYQITDVSRYYVPQNVARLKSLNECRDLKLVGITGGLANVLDTYLVRDTDVDDTVLAGGEEGITDPESSELGMFLRYSGGNIKINERPYDGFSTIVKKEDKAKKKGKLELNATDNAYERAMFDKNQIGDFLHFVDKERDVQKNIDKLESGIDELKANLKEIFATMGFELKDDLDLSVSADYDYVLKKLQTRKNTYVGQISSELDLIEHGNPVVNERFNKADNMYKALVQDSQALVILGYNIESGSPLEESIKTAKANQKVIEKTQKEAYSTLQKEIDNYEQPVCMPY